MVPTILMARLATKKLDHPIPAPTVTLNMSDWKSNSAIGAEENIKLEGTHGEAPGRSSVQVTRSGSLTSIHEVDFEGNGAASGSGGIQDV